MTKYSEETSVPTDEELLRWGWKTNHIARLRKLPASLQNIVLEEYIKRMMENSSSEFLDF